MNSNDNSIEIEIETKYDSDCVSNLEYKSSDDEEDPRRFQNNKELINFKKFYNVLFILSTFFGMFLQLFDLGSDIYILVDLYLKEIYYFYSCLTIIIITSFANSLSSMLLTTNDRIKKTFNFFDVLNLNALSNGNKKKAFIYFLMGLFHLNIFNEIYYSIKYKKKTSAYILSRFLEGILESGPQSIFQLFIILKTIESASLLDLSRYYFSVSLSIISLALSLVSFEIYYYKEKYENNQNYISDVNELTYFSPYIITISFFRIFEISSRIIFVALLSYITKTGFAIIFFLLTDIVLSGYLQHLIDFLNIDKKYQTKLYLEFKKDFESSKLRTLFKMIILQPLITLGNLISLPYPLFLKTDYEEMNMNLYHYEIKFITDLFCIGMIIYKFIIGGYNTSFMILSIISMIGFTLKNILLLYIKKWTKDEKYKNIFLPFKLGCFKNCFENCCGNKK